MAEEVCTSLYTEGASSTHSLELADVSPGEYPPIRHSTLYGSGCSVYSDHLSTCKVAAENRRCGNFCMNVASDFDVWYQLEVKSS